MYENSYFNLSEHLWGDLLLKIVENIYNEIK